MYKITKYLVIMLLTLQSGVAQTLNNSPLGKNDLFSLLKAVPVLQATPEAAFLYKCNNDVNCQSGSPLEDQYDAFKQKMELFSNNMQAALSAKHNDYLNEKGTDGIRRDLKNQVNENGIVKDMGGVDKISGMSERELEISAKKAAASQMSSMPFSPFSEAEMQRMMSDPDYARQMTEKFNNMTDAQKAALVQGKLATMDNSVSNEEFEQQMKGAQEVKNAIDVTAFVNNSIQKMREALATYGTKLNNARATKGNHNDLRANYETEYQKIPLVEMGEGQIPDPAKVRELKRNYAHKHKKRAAMELELAIGEFRQFEAAISACISDYYAYLDENEFRINGSMNALYKGTNTEVSLAQLELGIGAAIGDLAALSFSENTIASGYEQQLQLELNAR